MFKKLYFFVYIMTNEWNKVFYVGITNDIARRVWEHREGAVEGFTEKYNLTKLVYYEEAEDALSTIAREKKIKGWLRIKKVALIEAYNPEWNDLA